MEEINLFHELNKIKIEIDKDLSIIDMLEYELKLKTNNHTNKELQIRINKINEHFGTQCEQLKNENYKFKTEIEKLNELCFEKDNLIQKLNTNLNVAHKEGKNLEIYLKAIKGKIAFFNFRGKQ